MKNCPFCAEEIQDAAIVCKHCGRDLNTPPPPKDPLNTLFPGAKDLNTPTPGATESTASTSQGKKGSGCSGCLGVFLLLILLIGVISFLSTTDDSPEDQQQQAEDTELFDARVMTRVLCEAAVEERLVSPSTADFPFMGPRVQAIRPSGNYRWQSYVDSQNAFGGTIRSNFICDTRGVGDNPGDWTITNFVIE